MNRRLLYYFLTVCVSIAFVGGLLNCQFVLVGENGPWNRALPWELILVGWGSLFYALASISLAWLSDRFGRLPCILTTLLILVAICGVLGSRVLGPYRLWQLFVSWGLANLCFSLLFTSVEGLLSDYQDHRVPLSRRLGGYCLAWSIGDMIAAFASGHLKQAWGDRAVFLSIAAVVLIGSIAALFDWVRHGDRKLGHHDIGLADIRPAAPFHALLGRIGIFFGCFAYMALTAALPRYGTDFHHLTEGTIGNLVAVIMLSAVGAFLFLSRWTRWHYRRGWQWGLQLPLVAGALVAIAAPSGVTPLLALGFVLFGFGWGCTYFFSIYYSLTVPHSHAKSGGIHEAVIGLGNLTGPFASAAAIWFAGRHALLTESRVGVLALWVAVCGVLLSLVIQAMLMQRRQNLRALAE